MKNILLNKLIPGLTVVLALFCAIPAAQAAAVTYNFTITGTVLDGDEVFSNAYNLSAGETITATGTFTADLGTIGNETGTVLFGLNSFNTMSIDLNFDGGGEIINNSADVGYSSDTGPSLTFVSGSLTDFNFLKTGSTEFNSLGLYFDDLDSMFGEWTSATLTPIPVPAAVWLFGSGLLGLVSLARRKKK